MHSGRRSSLQQCNGEFCSCRILPSSSCRINGCKMRKCRRTASIHQSLRITERWNGYLGATCMSWDLNTAPLDYSSLIQCLPLNHSGININRFISRSLGGNGKSRKSTIISWNFGNNLGIFFARSTRNLLAAPCTTCYR